MIAVVIGGGIVGLHVARALQEKGQGDRPAEVFVLDRSHYPAEGTSGRNSGVIHSGIFYRPGSFKERVCLEGNRLTYEWLKRLQVPHRPCGKWVVPEEGQEEGLAPFFERVRSLPIPPPEFVARRELASREPALRPSDAIFIPSTGILDAAGYVKSLIRYLEERGGTVLFDCKVTGVNGNRLETTRGPIDFDLGINSAGLQADEIARMIGMTDYEIRPCRGDYYLLNRQPVSRPVYHLPYQGAHGLGVHLTPTLDGQTLLGPNAFFIEEKDDYRHRSTPEAFEKGVRFFLPHLKEFSIAPAYSGNRPKLFRRGEALTEFVIEKKGDWIHLLGIESPGLTAAPALANEVLKLL